MRSDRPFAPAPYPPTPPARGEQVAETATVALMQPTGRWLTVLGPMSDLAIVCQRLAPKRS
jgi:hypothetical protein